MSFERAKQKPKLEVQIFIGRVRDCGKRFVGFKEPKPRELSIP